MGKIKDFFKKINGWIIKQAEKTDEIYKLDSSGELPDLGELKMAHFRLLREYSLLIGNSHRLSYFINYFEYRKSTAKPSIKRLIFYYLNMLESLAVTRPFLSLLIEAHIKNKLKELERVYTQTKSLVPFYHRDQKKYSDWFEAAIVECRGLSSTLSISESIKNLSLSLVSFLTVTGGITAILQSLSSAYTLAWLAIFLLFSSVFLFTFINANFSAKRDLFSKPIEEIKHNIYLIENQLFNLLNRKKKPEWALDYLGFGLIFFPSLIVLKLSFNLSNLYVHAGLVILYLITTIVFIRKREMTNLV